MTGEPAARAWGTLTLHVNDKPVGEGRIRTQPGKFSLAGEGLNVGRDGGEPVTDDYPGGSPWQFVGGELVDQDLTEGEEQPWKAVLEGDQEWLAGLTQHLPELLIPSG